MSIGNTVPYQGYEAILGFAKETTFGTFVTSTMWLEFNSESLKYTLEEIKVEAINTYRDYTRRLRGNTTVDGGIESNWNLAADACQYMIKSALGGTVSSVIGSGSSYTHTFRPGDLENNKSSAGASDIKSLSIAVRPGASGAQTLNFFGLRANQLSLKSEPGGPIVMSTEFIGKGCSLSSTMPTAVLTTVNPLMFNNAKIWIGTTIGACTSTTEEFFKSFELTINNNLLTDHRVLGNTEIVGLPAGKRDIVLKLSQVFDTFTSYSRYLENTATAFLIYIDSSIAYGASVGTYKAQIKLPKCYLNPFTPAVGGNEALNQELEFRCMYASEQAYSAQIEITNLTANYD